MIRPRQQMDAQPPEEECRSQDVRGDEWMICIVIKERGRPRRDGIIVGSDVAALIGCACGGFVVILRWCTENSDWDWD